ncbi:MAG: hypothetical protein GXX96_31170 [Planctomycetaceae bacterium]|nr:hypothetical protein [Planctomycetaceae bacterium]
MTTTIINKRTTDADDAERLRKRADVREKAFRLQLEKDKIGPLEAVLTDSFARVETATDAHAAVCGPLQTELNILEAAAVERIQQRQPPDAIDDARRVQILREITSENATLEAVVEAEKTFRAPTERQIWELKNQVTDPNAILLRLGQHPYASPKLLGELHVAQQRIKWLRARQQAAERSLKIHTYNRDEIQAKRSHGDLAASLRHIANWTAEIEAVGSELADAMTSADSVHKQLLNE